MLPLLALAAFAGAAPQAPRTVDIQASDNMRFTPGQIQARPGEQLRVVLKDVGTVPKAAMAHNFVLLRKGADPKAFCDKSAGARDTDFIAPAVKGDVLAATKLVGPGETAEVTFAAPAQPGSYTFVCSFPGHFAIGMKGTLTVK
ncbi:MAG: plastocyanin/azurin family copper-binding protein [Bacteroidales bacterium]